MTVLERLDEFHLYKSPAKALFDEERAAQMIPMKPIFYDLAYDLLEPPKLFVKRPIKTGKAPEVPPSPRGLFGGIWTRS